MPRNRQQTESRIQEAALRILRRDGFEGWGVNHIAREAGVDKVLLYRYFNGIEGLLARTIEAVAFWPDPEALPTRSPEAWIEATLAHHRACPEIHTLLASPAARGSVSSIRRKFNADLDRWRKAFQAQTEGSIPPDAAERLPALILYQAVSGQENLSPHDIWRQLSPPLQWDAEGGQGTEPEELPPEML